MPSLPPEIAALLANGEKILWSGQPRPSVFIQRGLPNLAYGVTWSVLGAFWYHGAGGVGEYSAFSGWWRIVPILSVPFIFAGFSFWLYPLRLGPKARHTWYVVTDRRVFIAELPSGQSPHLRVFSPEEMAPPQVVQRFDRPPLTDVIFTHRAQKNPHLLPALDEAFFGLADGEAAVVAIKSAMQR